MIESTIFKRNQRQASTIGHRTKHTIKHGHFEEVIDTSTYHVLSKSSVSYSCSLDIELIVIIYIISVLKLWLKKFINEICTLKGTSSGLKLYRMFTLSNQQASIIIFLFYNSLSLSFTIAIPPHKMFTLTRCLVIAYMVKFVNLYKILIGLLRVVSSNKSGRDGTRYVQFFFWYYIFLCCIYITFYPIQIFNKTFI